MSFVAGEPFHWPLAGIVTRGGEGVSPFKQGTVPTQSFATIKAQTVTPIQSYPFLTLALALRVPERTRFPRVPFPLFKSLNVMLFEEPA